jgi:hypothetical protein
VFGCDFQAPAPKIFAALTSPRSRRLRPASPSIRPPSIDADARFFFC